MVPSPFFRRKVMPKAKCPKCNNETNCFCKKGGGKVGFDEFVLICVNCGYSESSKQPIGSPDALAGAFSAEYPNCPFCGETATEHSEPPKSMTAREQVIQSVVLSYFLQTTPTVHPIGGEVLALVSDSEKAEAADAAMRKIRDLLR